MHQPARPFLGRVIAALAAVSTAAGLALVGAVLSPAAADTTSGPTSVSLDSGWERDRALPSGGYEAGTAPDDTPALHIGVNPPSTASSSFYQYEGIKKAVDPAQSISADLYLDSTWGDHTRVSLWGGGYDASNAVSSYPVLEYTTDTTLTGTNKPGWRIFDSAGDHNGWRSIPVPVTDYSADGWNTIQMVIDPEDDTHTDVYLNGHLVGISIGDPTTHFGTIYLQDYDYNSSEGAGDPYDIYWASITLNAPAPASVPDGVTGWVTDRTTPSGGYDAGTGPDGTTTALHIGVTPPSGAASSFYQYEGLKKTISSTTSISADLYLDSTWGNHTRVSLWGGGYDGSGAASSYPVLEYNTDTSLTTTGWRIFDSSDDVNGWRPISIPAADYTMNAFNTIQMVIDPYDNTHTDIYLNGHLVGISIGDPTTHFGTIYLQDYDYNTAQGAEHDSPYDIYWANITGNAAAPTAPTTPGAARTVTATAGNGTAVVRWSAPATDGGWAVTGYTVTATGGSTPVVVHAGASATSATLTGLTNGTRYTVTVVPSNGLGASTATPTTVSVTPTAPLGTTNPPTKTCSDGSVIAASATCPTPPPVTTGDNGTTNVTVPVQVGSDGKQTAKVDTTTIADAIKAATTSSTSNGNVVLNVTTTSTGTGTPAGTPAPVSVSIPAAAISSASASTVASVAVETDAGTLTLDTKVLGAIAALTSSGTTPGDVTLAITPVAASTGSAPTTFEVSVSVGDQAVHTFGGGVLQVTVPYAPAADQDPSDIVVIYRDADGSVELMPTTAGADGVTFTSPHLSTFEIYSLSAITQEMTPSSKAAIRSAKTKPKSAVLKLTSVPDASKIEIRYGKVGTPKSTWKTRVVSGKKSSVTLKGLKGHTRYKVITRGFNTVTTYDGATPVAERIYSAQASKTFTTKKGPARKR